MMRKRPIRVLLVGPDLPLVGGQTVQARMLTERFKADEEVQLDLQPINPKFLALLQRVKYLRTGITTFKYVLDLVSTIPRYDVIHIFSASYFSFLLAPVPALIISRIFRKKTILNYRSGEADDHLARWRSAVPTINLFDRVVAPSDYLVDVFEKYKIKATSIANVVDTTRYIFKPRSPLRPLFLSNRNLEPLYNVECIVRAFGNIQRAFPDARLLIAGDGSQRESLEALVQKLELKNVEFLGSIPPAEMPAIYERADVYLNAPNLDNMPNSLIEAFACGMPVVSTNAGGIPYIVEHERNGLLVDIGDDEALARQAIRLLRSPALAEFLAHQARADCENYSWEKVRSEWVQIYRELSDRQLRQAAHLSEAQFTARIEN